MQKRKSNENTRKSNNPKYIFPASLDPTLKNECEGILLTGILNKCLPSTNNQTYIKQKKLKRNFTNKRNSK